MNTQSGNVIIYVLIAVALLAALSYVVAGNSRGNSHGSKERAALSATEILEYANNLSQAVALLRLRGCQEDELSFDNDVEDTLYDNLSAPGDGSCNVFHVNGGSIQYGQFLSVFFTGGYSLSEIGSAEPDLIVDIDVSKSVCEILNNSLSIQNNGTEGPPSDALSGGAAFDGSFSLVGGANGRTDEPQFLGRLSACRHDSGVGSDAVFKYYRVLIAR